MSIPGNQVGLISLPNQHNIQTGNSAGLVFPGGLNFLDQFQRTLTEAKPQTSPHERLKLKLLHPILNFQIRKFPAPSKTGETRAQELKMYAAIHQTLNAKGKRALNALLQEGVLTSADTDNKHTTLYQLYSMLKTPRSPGYEAKTLVQETVDLLYQPYTITQKFEPLSENATREILELYNNPNSTLQNYPSGQKKPLTWKDLDVENSATCVSSSLMYYMADKMPGELVRHLNELTSPMNAFYEKVKLSELSPDDPKQAFEILKQHQIPYYISGPDEVSVKVENPPSGVIRARDSQDVQSGSKYRNAIMAAYQSTLTHLATRSYDPATDLRDADAPGETSKGLTEEEKTLMETIIKDNGGVQSITYQVVNGKAAPEAGEEGNAYLYGYTRSFQQTASDLLESLRLGEPVIIGITDTDNDGTIVGGHELTITGATTDPKTGELKFIVADSDDDVSSLVIRSARELIPRIHHAGMPLKLAKQINSDIQANNGYLVPDETDAANFQLLPRQTGPYPQDAPVANEPSVNDSPPPANPPEQPVANGPSNPASNPAVVNWMPVLVNPPLVNPVLPNAFLPAQQ